jgi:ssDNA-binding Zn-finger/Zn-ribbon topoisomerase 1
MVDFYKDTDLLIACPNCGNPFPVSLKRGEVHYEECAACSYLPEQNEILPQVEDELANANDAPIVVICVLPAGDQVICDLCNSEVDDAAEGGSFSGSYSLCPKCTKRIWANSSEVEKKEITLVEGPFKTAVLKKRVENSQM